MNPVKTAVIGASGYIGKHLWTEFKRVYPDAVGTSFGSIGEGFTHFDIRRPDISSLELEGRGYESVIICAAKPNIGYCETNQAESYAVNTQGTLELVRQLGKTKLQAIFLSTDYVFDGCSGGYSDKSVASPTTEYGKQKALVEQLIPTITDDYLILRIGKIYGSKKGDKTILDEIASSLASGSSVSCASDQFFCPTHVDDLVKAIIEIQTKRRRGLMNLCADESWSRYQIAIALADEMGVELGLVRETALHDLPAMAGRPLNTTMKCESPIVQDLQKGFRPLSDSIKIVAANYSTVDR